MLLLGWVHTALFLPFTVPIGTPSNKEKWHVNSPLTLSSESAAILIVTLIDLKGLTKIRTSWLRLSKVYGEL